MRVACSDACTAHVHASLAHRTRALITRITHTLHHDPHVVSDQRNDVIKSYDHGSVVSDQQSYDQGHESVVSDHVTMTCVDQDIDQDASIRCLHDQGIKARTGKAPTLRPRQVAGKEGRSEGDRLLLAPPVEGGSVEEGDTPDAGRRVTVSCWRESQLRRVTGETYRWVPPPWGWARQPLSLGPPAMPVFGRRMPGKLDLGRENDPYDCPQRT
jgi:hypothetical protein